MIRDLCIAATGAWSVSQVVLHARLLGIAGRQETLKSEVFKSCGKPTRKAGGRISTRGVEILSTESVPDALRVSIPESVPKEKKKNQKEKKYIYTPRDTSYHLPPEIAPLEADVRVFLDSLAEANKTGGILGSRADSTCRELVELHALYGPETLRYAMRTAIAKPAGIEYVRAVAKSRANASGTDSLIRTRNRNGISTGPSLFSQRESVPARDISGGSNYAVVLEGSKKC